MLKLLSILAVGMFVLATAPVQAAPATGLHSLNNPHSIALRALVGHRVSALHHRGLVYELRSEQGILFTFNKAVPVAAPEGLELYWSGIASLTVGLLLLLAQFAKRRAV